MARVNLLPWRQQQRLVRHRYFYLALVMTVIVAVAPMYLLSNLIDTQLAQQQVRNQLLQAEIANANLVIDQIQLLEAKRQTLLTRAEQVQRLQQSRAKLVKVFNELVSVVPDGINLKKLTRSGGVLRMEGIAESHDHVSLLLRQLDQSAEFVESKLDWVKRTSTDDNGVRVFSLEVNETNPDS